MNRIKDAVSKAVTYALSTYVDASTRETTEAAVRESEARFRELAEAIHGVLWLTDLDNTKTFYVSPGYERIFGRTREALDANARDWMEAVVAADRARMTEFIATPTLAPRSAQYRIVLPNGAIRSIRTEIFPVRDSTGAVTRIAGMTEDVTERVELEDQVRQTQKLESLGLLAGGIAHDFNNILAVIGANIGMLQEICRAPDTIELVKDVKDAVGRAVALTRQLLAFSRKQVTLPVVLDVNAAISETYKMLRRMVGEDIVIKTSFSPDAARACIDPGHLMQVLMNLIVNARDAMEHGGTLTITTRNAMSAAGPEVQISIADTGCGMTDEVRRRAFEPLFTTKQAGLGTGLGLSVVHGIVKSAGGRIEIESELGRGTTFQIHLPAVDAPAEKVDSVMATVAQGIETILFVDDDLHVCASASRALRAKGYVVLEASDGDAALKYLRDQADGIDLLVTDVVMPGMNGRELADAARAEQPSLRVLYTSGYTDVVRHGIRHDEVPFLEKPYTVHHLAGKVRQLLDVS